MEDGGFVFLQCNGVDDLDIVPSIRYCSAIILLCSQVHRPCHKLCNVL